MSMTSQLCINAERITKFRMLFQGIESKRPVTEEKSYEIPCFCTALQHSHGICKHKTDFDTDNYDKDVEFLEEERRYDEILVAATNNSSETTSHKKQVSIEPQESCSIQEMIIEQADDEYCENLRIKIDLEQPVSFVISSETGLMEQKTGDETQIVVPNSSRQRVLSLCHDSVTVSHPTGRNIYKTL